MSFAQVITDCRGQENEKSARQLRTHLEKNGVPSVRDLGALRHLRELYAELPGVQFDRILQESSKT